MEPIAIARRLAELGQKAEAQQAYTVALEKQEGLSPMDRLEAASYFLLSW